MLREVFPICQNWRFRPGFQPSWVRRECNESRFEKVTLPHTAVHVPYSGFDERLYQGLFCYRRRFRLPDRCRGKRVFVDFGGAMTAAKVYSNGVLLGEHCGGYLPFSFDLTESIRWGEENVLAVELDTHERKDIPPFGGAVDYLTYGGLYREVSLRAVPSLSIESIAVLPLAVGERDARLEIGCGLLNFTGKSATPRIKVEILDGTSVVLHGEETFQVSDAREQTVTLHLPVSGELSLWERARPVLYHARVSLYEPEEVLDADSVRFGFRECRFTPEGFRLNGRVIPLRGLNRHQSYPWVGYAMPPRVQRRDADLLKEQLKVNMVRTSHYPQSRHFLDRCDEIGLLVFEEIPGWQHIGDEAWQERVCSDVASMIRRDINHPSIVLWGVRINESADCDPLYRRTNAIAHELDPSRQTGGVRFLPESNLIEDVFTFNDFNPERLRQPSHPLHLVTEFGGHMYPTKHVDNVERVTEHARRHAHILSQAAATPGIAGALGWCAFDYNTHGNFGSGDRICHHGVCDMFRIPKVAAGVYRAQCSPEEEVILEPAFAWTFGDRPVGGGVGPGLINSNCDRLRLFLGGEPVAELKPDVERFPGLVHPPFVLNERFAGLGGERWRNLVIEGLIGDEVRIRRTLSARCCSLATRSPIPSNHERNFCGALSLLMLK